MISLKIFCNHFCSSVSHGTVILQWETKTTLPRGYQCVWYVAILQGPKHQIPTFFWHGLLILEYLCVKVSSQMTFFTSFNMIGYSFRSSVLYSSSIFCKRYRGQSVAKWQSVTWGRCTQKMPFCERPFWMASKGCLRKWFMVCPFKF